jgi:hypothetical protein
MELPSSAVARGPLASAELDPLRQALGDPTKESRAPRCREASDTNPERRCPRARRGRAWLSDYFELKTYRAASRKLIRRVGRSRASIAPRAARRLRGVRYRRTSAPRVCRKVRRARRSRPAPSASMRRAASQAVEPSSAHPPGDGRAGEIASRPRVRTTVTALDRARRALRAATAEARESQRRPGRAMGHLARRVGVQPPAER